MSDLEREFDPAVAGCGYRAPLAPHLARPMKSSMLAESVRGRLFAISGRQADGRPATRSAAVPGPSYRIVLQPPDHPYGQDRLRTCTWQDSRIFAVRPRRVTTAPSLVRSSVPRRLQGFRPDTSCSGRSLPHRCKISTPASSIANTNRRPCAARCAPAPLHHNDGIYTALGFLSRVVQTLEDYQSNLVRTRILMRE